MNFFSFDKGTMASGSEGVTLKEIGLEGGGGDVANHVSGGK